MGRKLFRRALTEKGLKLLVMNSAFISILLLFRRALTEKGLKQETLDCRLEEK